MTRLLGLVSLLLTAAIAAGDEGDVPPPPAGVTVRELAGGRITEAVLAGSALGVTVLPGALAILLAPEDDAGGPRSLVRFDPSGDGSLTVVARGLPPETDSIGSLDVDGDGRPEVIVGEPGRIHVLGPLAGPADRRPRVWLEAPHLDLAMMRRHDLIRAEPVLLAQPRVGRLEIFRAGDGGVVARAAEIALPMRARRLRTGLRLSTPPVQLIERPGTGTPWLAVGPELQGSRRLLTTLIDPAAEGDAPVAAEAWCRLPAEERVAQSWYLSIDGLPALAVAALRADKLGIFEKKKLRVFPLRTDRTRAGVRPALEIQTVTRNWYPLGVRAGDFDRDGRDDLIVLQPDGLGAKKLVVEVYRGKGNGGFFLTPRRSVVVAPQAAWTFADVDGDGVGDLVAFGDDHRLQVFRGLGASRRKQVLEKAPRWSFETGTIGEAGEEIVIHVGEDDGDSDSGSGSDIDAGHLGGPRVVDLDGDGRGEILLHSSVGGRSILRVFELL